MYLTKYIALLLLSFFIYSALAQNEQAITVLGTPMLNQNAVAGQWRRYFIDIDATLATWPDGDAFYITLTPYSGDVDLFVSNNQYPSDPSACAGCWSSTGPHGDIVTIRKTDPNFPTEPASKLFIGVYPRTPSVFSINAFLSSTRIKLEEAFPQSTVVPGNKYQYFDYFHEEASNFTVGVTPNSGDPDLYISTVYTEPNSTNAEFRQLAAGYDVQMIGKYDPRFKAPSPYYIGVHAYFTRESYFTIYATKDNNYTLTTEGVPLQSKVRSKEYRYFKFYLANAREGQRLTVTLIPLAGEDPDLYVKYGVSDPFPSPTNCDFCKSAPGQDVATIENARKGWYYIGVYGWTPDRPTAFALLVNSDLKSQTVIEGRNYPGYVPQGGYNFYKYHVGDKQSGVTFTISPTENNCPISAYFSTSDTNVNPTREPSKNDFQAPKIGATSIAYFRPTIRYNDVYFSVYGDAACNYTVIVQSNQTATLLRNGQTIYYNSVPQGYYRYFEFEIPNTYEDVVIAANPERGDVDLFASTLVERPTRENHTYAAQSWRADTLDIPAGDEKLYNRRRIYIGVYGRYDSTFAITAFMGNTSVPLQDGIPTRGGVMPRNYRFFKYFIRNPGSVTITLAAKTPGGDVDLFASFESPKPTSEDYEYRGIKYGNDYIEIPYAWSGFLYIGVKGIIGSPCAFDLTVTQEYTLIVPNSQSTLSITPKGKTQQFQSMLWWDYDYAIVAVTVVRGRTKLMVAFNDTSSVTEQNYQYVDASWPGNVLLISRPGTSRMGSRMRIGVLAMDDSAEYYLSVTTTGGSSSFWVNAASLREGVPRLGIAPPSLGVNYVYSMPWNWTNPDAPVEKDQYVQLRILSGEATIYIHQDWNIAPNPLNYTWKATGKSDQIVRLPRDQLIKWRPIYMGVFTEKPTVPTVFEISIAAAGAPKYLAQDQPTRGYVRPGGYNLFRVLNSVLNPKDIRVWVDSCSSAPAPTFFMSPDNPNPDETSFAQKSNKYEAVEHDYTQFMVIPVIKDKPMLYLSVKGEALEGNSFSIFTTDGSDSRPIVKNRKLSHQYDNGQILFRFERALATTGFSDANFKYMVFVQDVKLDPSGMPMGRNFETVCGVLSHASADGEATPTADKLALQYLVNADRSKIYRVNVLVRDGYGLSSAYKPVWIVDGRVWDSWPGLPEPFQVSIGFIILLTLFLIAVAYIVVGSSINLLRGKRGLDLLPQSRLWAGLLLLIYDGFVFVVCCELFRRRRREYADLADETDAGATAVNTAGFESTPASVSSSEPKAAASTGGYGAI